MDFTIYSEGEAYPRGWLKREFYRMNKFPVENWDGTKRIEIGKPIGQGEFSNETTEKITFVYRRGYFVTVEQGNSALYGPHVAKLYLTLKGYENPIWLGTCQLEGSFYNEGAMQKQLKLAIKRKEYFCSIKSNEEEFVIQPEGDIVVVEDVIDSPSEPASKKGKRKYVQLVLDWWFNEYKVLCYDPVTCPLCGVKKRRLKNLESHFHRKHPRNLLGVSWHEVLDKRFKMYYNTRSNGVIPKTKQGSKKARR